MRISNKMTLVAALALAALATASNAATLTVAANQASYNIGDTVTLTVTGDSEGAQALGVFGQLLFSNPAVAAIGTGTPTSNALLAFGSIPWTTGVLSCGAGFCTMFDQLSAFGLNPAPASNLLIATVSFQALAQGVTNVNWNNNAATGFQLNFFGLTDAAGTSFEVVPEPTTAALMGLGLFTLAITGRRRA